MNELNINDFFIDKSHKNELFDDELSSIEFDHDAIKNRVNEKISFIRELDMLNRLFICWLNKNESFSHDLFQNNELSSELSQNEDLFNHDDSFNDKNLWREEKSSTTLALSFAKFNEKESSTNVKFYLIRCRNEFTSSDSYVFFSIRKNFVSIFSELVKDHEELWTYKSSRVSIESMRVSMKSQSHAWMSIKFDLHIIRQLFIWTSTKVNILYKKKIDKVHSMNYDKSDDFISEENNDWKKKTLTREIMFMISTDITKNIWFTNSQTFLEDLDWSMNDWERSSWKMN